MKLPHRKQTLPFAALAIALSSAFFVFLASFSLAAAQSAPGSGAAVSLEVPERSWVESAAQNELQIIKDNGKMPLRYRVHKIDSKGDITREVIETRDGSVARLVERNGQKLTAEEDAAERDRLQEILASPGDFIQHHKRDDPIRTDSLQLVSQMPQAMIFIYTPGQPQLPGTTSRQIVIDFHPDPNYKSPQTLDNLLTGIEGRMWIDAQSHRMVRIEGNVRDPVNFGWGILGKINKGGKIVLEQANASGDRWVYSQLDTHLTLRFLVVKTVEMNDKMTQYDFRPLPAPMSVQEAVRTLLAMPVPLR
jgi:hypothetical protein